MKKTLAILLVFCLMITSLFSFPVYAEETASSEGKKAIALESFFGDGTNWSARGSAKAFDEDGDGVKEVIRLTSSSTANIALRSPSFTLIPGDEYELTYYVRVPGTSGEFFTEAGNYCPRTAFFQPTVTEDGVKVTDNYSVKSNDYAYKDVRRTNFASTWQVDGYEPYARNRYSVIDHTHFCSASPNEAYKNWTKVTMNFTAIDDEETGAVGNQITALYFTFNANKAIDGLIYDIKDLTLKNKSVVVEEEEEQNPVVFSDFSDYSDTTKWKYNQASAASRTKFMDETGDGVADYVNLTTSTGKNTYITSLPTTLVPGTEYELSFYFRVPNTSADYASDTQKVAPRVYIYQPTIDETTGLISTAEDGFSEGNSEYAYKGNGDTTIIRRANFIATWQIGDYKPYERDRFSSFSQHYAVCIDENGNEVLPNVVYKNWTKITATFTAIDDETAGAVGEQVVAFRFGLPKYLANLELDVKDLVLIDKSKLPTEPEVPEEPEEPVGPAEIPYISVVDTNGNQHKYGADIGAKVDVTANADGTKTFALTYDAMDGVNVFKGWFDGDTFLSADTTFIASADVNKDNVKAKILCRSVISGGLGFESYTESTTSLHVHPEDASQNLHNVAPFDDKWGQMYKEYQPTNEFLMTIEAINGTKTVKYKSTYIDGAFATDFVDVTPYSGNSMFNMSMVSSRSIVRKLDNLKPNTTYDLSFYVYNTSDFVFLNTAIISDSYQLATGGINSSSAKVYNYYKAETETNNKYEQKYGTPNNGFKAVKDLARTWHKVSVNFTTDADDTELYLQFATECAGDTSRTTGHVFVDNLTCCEMGVGYTGNAIRGEDSALRYKFYVDNDMLEGYAGMTTKKVGVLAAKSDLCGDESLEIGKSFAKDVEVKEENLVTDSTDSSNKYFTVALYNIGRKDGSIDYSAYGSDFAVRPYIIYEDDKGEETVIYGDTIDASIFKVMLTIFGDNRDENDIDLAGNILTANEDVLKAFFDWQPTDGWYFGESQAKDYAFSFAVVGDTQKTTGYYSDKLHYIYDWIINNKDAKNIQYVLGLGDITESKNEDKEWPIATEQLDRLEEAGINQSIVRGNHDDEPYYDQFITMDKYGKNLTGSYDGTMRNTYRLITINGIKYMMLTLDFQTTEDVIAWAKDIVDTHKDYNVILTTHSYFDHNMSYDKDPDNNKTKPETSGVELFENLVSKCSNIVLVMSGHRYPPDNGPNYIIAEREDGSKVMQMMVNPQKHESDEGRSFGMLAMLYFSEDGRNVQLEYFSTINGMFYKDKFQFDFTLDLVD